MKPEMTLAKDFSAIEEAIRDAHSALDTLMGDSDIHDDESPEFAACIKLTIAEKALKRIRRGYAKRN